MGGKSALCISGVSEENRSGDNDPSFRVGGGEFYKGTQILSTNNYYLYYKF